MHSHRNASAALLALAIAMPRAASAWVANGTPIGLDCGGLIEYPNALPDGAGGAYFFWRTGPDELKRLDASGDLVPGWASCGPVISTDPLMFNLQYEHAECPDGAGGIFLMFCVIVGCPAHCGADPRQVYLQRVTPGGAIAPGWPSIGLAITSNFHPHGDPTVVPDGAGGALLAWTDQSAGSQSQVFAQRIAADGTPLWDAGGVAMGLAVLSQRHPAILPATDGGATLIWEDQRLGAGQTDLYVRRVTPLGVALGPGSVALCTVTGTRNRPMTLSDGAGGGYVIWRDTAGGVTHISGQRLDAAAATQWDPSGIVLSGSTPDLLTPRPRPDGAGGFFISWADSRNAGTTGLDLYAARVTSDGSPAPGWPADGLPLCTEIGDQSGADLSIDGLGGFFAIWSDARSGAPRLYGTHRRGDLTVASGWPAQGLPLCAFDSDQYPVALVPSVAGSAIAMWVDEREPLRDGTYATRIVGDGPVAALATLVQVDCAAGKVELIWDLSSCAGTATLERDSGSGWAALDSALPDGTCRVTCADRSVAPGARYGYRLAWSDLEGPHHSDEVWVDVPRGDQFALGRSRFLEGGTALAADCALPHAGEARLVLMDVAGRRLASTRSSAAGPVTLVLKLQGRLPAGVYVLALEQGSQRVSRAVTRLP